MTARRRFLFADSEVAAVTVVDGRLHVRFAAAQVSVPDSSVFSGVALGHVAGVALVCTGGPWPALQAGQVGRLAEGRVRDADGWHTHLPLPVELGTVHALELRFANRAALVATVTSLVLTGPPDAVWSESLAC